MNYKTTFDKYWWTYEHPKLQGLPHGSVWIEVTPHMVDPVTLTIEDDAARNTQMQFWVECGGSCEGSDGEGVASYHDWNLDCGGSSWEEAISNLYDLVLEHYGEYTND